MNKRCYIAGAGEFCESRLPEHDDYIIAADGGYIALSKFGITPDLIVGDFDSLKDDPELMQTLSGHPNVIGSSVEKDDTDMMLAVRQGLKRGFSTFIINGGLGGRLDQTIANIQILVYIAKKGASGVLYGKKENVTVIKDDAVILSPGESPNVVISVYCHGKKAKGVTLKGVKYPLDNAVLTNSYPIGTSNEFIGKNATISVQKGILVIVYPGDAGIENEQNGELNEKH